MEDAAEALKLAFSVFAFIIAIGLAFTTFNQSKSVSDIVIARNDRTYVESYSEADITSTDSGRIVGAETIVPTLYRYYKEKYAIDIVDDGEIVEVFDLETETKYKNGTVESDDKYKNRIKYEELFPSGIHWIGSATNTDAKLRVDSYISKDKITINGEDVRHSTDFDFNTTYYQRFEETQTGIKYSIVNPESEDYDGSYFITESGTTKIDMTFEKIK